MFTDSYRGHSVVKLIISLLLFICISACGESGDNTSSEIDEVVDEELGSESHVFFIEQVSGDMRTGSGSSVSSGSGSESLTLDETDTYNVYRVDVDDYGAFIKLNSEPFQHFISTYLPETTEDGTVYYESVLWLEGDKLTGVQANGVDTFLIDISTLPSPICSLEFGAGFNSTGIYAEHNLTIAGPDLNCDLQDDNLLYSFEARPEGQVKPIALGPNEVRYGLSIYVVDEDGSASVYTAYYDDSEGVTEIIDTLTSELVSSYAFQLPEGYWFIANNRTYILDDNRLYSFTAKEFVEGEFDLESSYVQISESTSSYYLELPQNAYPVFDTLGYSGLATEIVDTVYLTGQGGIKKLNIETGIVSATLALSADLRWPHLSFIENSEIVFAIDNRVVYRVDLSSNQADQLYQITTGSYGWSAYKNKLLLTEYSSNEDAKAVHIIDTEAGVLASYLEARIEYSYYHSSENIRFLIREATASNGYRSSIELFDIDTLSTQKILGSAEVSDLVLGYGSSRYQLATDSTGSQVYIFDIEGKKPLKLVAQLDGVVRL